MKWLRSYRDLDYRPFGQHHVVIQHDRPVNDVSTYDHGCHSPSVRELPGLVLVIDPSTFYTSDPLASFATCWCLCRPSSTMPAVTGTVGVNGDGTYDPSIGVQTARSLAIIGAAIESLGGSLEHVIRTRMFVSDVSQWEAVAPGQGEVFKEIRPATTIVEVARLIDDAALIEIEADAIVP